MVWESCNPYHRVWEMLQSADEGADVSVVDL
jgi:hypothetical protein